MSTLTVIPCGKTKVWSRHHAEGQAPAKDAYIGPAFVVNREYAQKRGDPWVILSAKYGFLWPDDPVADYDVTFSKPETNPISVSELRNQARQRRLLGYPHVIVLAGSEYAKRVVQVFAGTGARVECPVAGLRYGESLQEVKKMTAGLGGSPCGDEARQTLPTDCFSEGVNAAAREDRRDGEPFNAV